MPTIVIYTDGACSGNPGPGGWGCIVDWDGILVEDCGGVPNTTNNRMELTAAIKPLQALPCPCEVTLYTDSQYLARAINDGWLANWKRNGWKNAKKAPVKNQDLWVEFDRLLQIHHVTLQWVKGHAGHPMNERCDALATSQIVRE